MVEQGWPWSFDGDGDLFRLVSEALRIHLAHLFDSALAVHTSLVEPLAHQITAVYQAMLPRQPLRFLLADDRGAGKTIMDRPADEGADRPRRPAALSGGLSRQPGRAVAGRAVPPLPPRLRDPHQRQAGRGAHRQLVPGERPRHRPAGQAGARWRAAGEAPGAPDCRWDLVVCDEAHKMSATFTGGEVRPQHVGAPAAVLLRRRLPRPGLRASTVDFDIGAAGPRAGRVQAGTAAKGPTNTAIRWSSSAAPSSPTACGGS